ncbi:MAG TPA: glucose 1-dehydrogenase [Burkholderiaceae bacterium]|nr:glucose 1-dehydrogenase [Burkholderiaceae bacterium]HQR75267.1 glucose 1-dehydrogenase [Burkholderiaceae bacterium]
MELQLQGKVALVTGGARGIGFATAQRLASEGAKLAIVDVNGAAAEEAAKQLRAGIEAIGVAADISREDEVKRMTQTVVQAFGRIDILVNSAAVLDDKLFLDSTPQDWNRVMGVCLNGAMLTLHAVLPGMVERGYGRVVCLASDSARVGQARLSYYAAAKAAVIALVKSVAQEVGDRGVTLNVVSPGATNTPLRMEREESLKQQMGEEKYARRVKTVLHMYPTGRLGEPDDIASAIAFLVSDRASWITGQVVSVNGGFVMP